MKGEALEALEALAAGRQVGSGAVTSDLSIDETLLLHAAGWEATDLVSGVSVWAVPYGTWFLPYGQTQAAELTTASRATTEAFRNAVEQLRVDCGHSDGQGVIGVDVDVDFAGNSIRVAFTGTSIRPIDPAKTATGRPFVTDLSTKDFVLLERGGWAPIDLAFGASFVAAPLQRLRQVMAQTTQNTELVNLTQALQNARELAMDRMQRAATGLDAAGIVDVSILDGPLHHSRHVLGFICWGTTVRLMGEQHRLIEPELVLPLNDDMLAFEATALRGGRG